METRSACSFIDELIHSHFDSSVFDGSLLGHFLLLYTVHDKPFSVLMLVIIHMPIMTESFRDCGPCDIENTPRQPIIAPRTISIVPHKQPPLCYFARRTVVPAERVEVASERGRPEVAPSDLEGRAEWEGWGGGADPQCRFMHVWIDVVYTRRTTCNLDEHIIPTQPSTSIQA